MNSSRRPTRVGFDAVLRHRNMAYRPAPRIAAKRADVGAASRRELLTLPPWQQKQELAAGRRSRSCRAGSTSTEAWIAKLHGPHPSTPSMTARRYLQLDVFADRPGAGNPLAVVLDADGLDD